MAAFSKIGDINWLWKKKKKRRGEEFELGRATGLVDHTDKKEIVIYTSPGRQHGQ